MFRLPPPVKTLIAIGAIYAIDLGVPFGILPTEIALSVAVLFAVLGLCVMLSAVIQFRMHQTTVNPYTPERTASIVTSGIFAYSRNPMYLGMALLVFAGVVYVANPIGLVVLAAFIVNMSAGQIKIEERALREQFGAAFDSYCQTVRRWI